MNLYHLQSHILVTFLFILVVHPICGQKKKASTNSMFTIEIMFSIIIWIHVFSIVEDLESDRKSGEPPVDATIPGKDILEDIIDKQQDGDKAQIEDPATEIIDEDQKPKIERVQRNDRRRKTKRR